MTVSVAGASLVLVLMVMEAAVSSRHDRTLRALGAVEPAHDVYRTMQIAYPATFLAMLAEGAWRVVQPDSLVGMGFVIFAVAKMVKYWAMASLGTRWTFRVLVPPGSHRTRRGPYRWIAHPNYVAVAGELVGLAIAMHAWLSGPLSVAGFSFLMLQRVQIEEKALAGE